MTAPITEQEVLDVLHAVERGEVTLDPEDVAHARAQYNGFPSFRLSNGWIVTVENDRREWNGIDSIKAPNMTLEREIADMPAVNRYMPPDPDLWGLDY